MNKFIVSARKYRPQNFSSVVGQSHITTTLKNAIRNQQLAHAFLFCGPRGVGKTTCARILAKAINCEHPAADGEACNECHSCLSFNEGTSLNIHELDAASNNSVDDIRSLVDQVRIPPQTGKYKVYIIDEVHMLSSSAFNAFLKTLEEPPPYAIFILATTEKHKILPTILSRCQVFDFKRITSSDIAEHLKEICEKENIGTETSAIEMIAQKSEGCMRDALSIMDKLVSFSNGKLTYADTLEHLNILDAAYYFKLLDALRDQQLANTLLIYDEINQKGFEGDLLLEGFSEFIRNLLVCKDERVAGLLDVSAAFRDKYQAAAKDVNAGYLISALNILNEAEINYKAARNKRLHVELALIKLAYLNQALQLAVADASDKKKGVDQVKPVAFRHIPPLEIREKKPEAQAPIQKNAGLPSDATITAKRIPVSSEAPSSGARLTIAEPAPVENRIPKQTVQTGTKTATDLPGAPDIVPSGLQNHSTPGGLGSLSKIRRQILDQKQALAGQPKPLDLKTLQEYWSRFTAALRENKNSAAQSFEHAALRIIDDQQFEILTNNNLEQRFIEQEKRNLSDLLQPAFNNRNLSFTVSIREEGSHPIALEKTLSKREQYQQIIAQYPLIKELKDKLKLELDY
ncbi:MAG TPA: DNA polymerase III subunit gamma/tau [Puia sp.]|nr:DNA polymerase III subunit gamma/tau [Puia sp.]